MQKNIRQGEASMRRSDRTSTARPSPLVIRPLLAALAAAGLAMPFAASAATIPVTTNADPTLPSASTCSLRQAIVAINTASVTGTTCVATGAFGTDDTVDLTLRTGTITLGGTEIPITTAVTINGPTAGPTNLTITGNNLSRVFNFTPTSSSGKLQITNLTIADGNAVGSGGCILSDTGGLIGEIELDASIVKNCTATTIPINNSPSPQVSSFTALGVGGGVATLGALLLSHSTVTGNTADFGGGGAFGLVVAAKYSSIANNTVTGTGCGATGLKYGCFGGGGVVAGGMYSFGTSVTGNTVHASSYSSMSPPAPTRTLPAVLPGTTAIGVGGGATVLFGYSAPSPSLPNTRLGRRVNPAAGKYSLIIASTISGNSITGPGSASPLYLGGGVYAFGAAFIDSTISGNAVTTGGFGSGIAGSALFVESSTVTGNTGIGGIAETYGALLTTTGAGSMAARVGKSRLFSSLRAATTVRAAAGPPLVLTSTIVANNTGPGADIECPAGPCTWSGGTSLVKKAGTGVTLPPGTITGVDPQLGPLTANGGWIVGAPGDPGTAVIRTHNLLAGSPAIDKGSLPSDLPFPYEFDERGPGFLRTQGKAPDIGAIEATAISPVPVLAPALLSLLSALVAALGGLGFGRRRPRL
jgi:CSLREA domain-containing protein